MSPVRARMLVEGRVQGVFFRDFTRRSARALSVGGWVRNLPDGRVEVLVEGELEAVRKLASQLESGPPGANVGRVEVVYEPHRGEFEDFRVRY